MTFSHFSSAECHSPGFIIFFCQTFCAGGSCYLPLKNRYLIVFLGLFAFTKNAVLDFLPAQYCRSLRFAFAHFVLRSPGFTRSEIRSAECHSPGFIVFFCQIKYARNCKSIQHPAVFIILESSLSIVKILFC